MCLGLGIAAVVGACGSTPASTTATSSSSSSAATSGDPSTCVPGEQIACACVGGLAGAQRCASDGKSYGTCDGCAGAGGAGGGAHGGDVAITEPALAVDAEEFELTLNVSLGEHAETSLIKTSAFNIMDAAQTTKIAFLNLTSTPSLPVLLNAGESVVVNAQALVLSGGEERAALCSAAGIVIVGTVEGLPQGNVTVTSAIFQATGCPDAGGGGDGGDGGETGPTCQANCAAALNDAGGVCSSDSAGASAYSDLVACAAASENCSTGCSDFKAGTPPTSFCAACLQNDASCVADYTACLND